MRRIVIATAVAVIAAGSWAFAQFGPPIELPNGWHIAAPPASLQTVGTLPTGIVISRDGAHAYELETGHRKPVLRILDAHTLAVQATVALGNAFGAPLQDAGADGMWIANTATFGEQIAHVDPVRARIDRTISLPPPFFPVAIARSPSGAQLAVAGDFANGVALLDAASGAVRHLVPTGRHPAAVAYSTDGRTLYVADRAESFVDAIDVAAARVRRRIAVGLHPVALLRDGSHLFVADSDDDDVAVVDTTNDRVVQRARLPFALRGIVGDSPNGLTLADRRLYVTCGAANAVAVFQVAAGRLTPLGAIPTGWYPTALAVEAATHALLIADGKGEGGHANPAFLTDPKANYVADNIVGAIRRIPIPTDAELRAGLATVESLGAPFARSTPQPDPIVRANGPIKHVIYVIKENRTYDQVLGDVATADGDPSLVMFGAQVTPNEHAIVGRFGVFDRFFCDAHVSADGHNWSNAAFANDYLEKMWPPNYDNRRAFYDFEDGATASVPHAGYIWDTAVRHGISLRDYGEFVTAGAENTGDNETRQPTSTMERGLIGRVDTHFAAFDMQIRDVDRFAEWKREFDAYERTSTLPQLEIVRLPRDHTAGTKTGENTPAAMVADNDRAVGLLIDAVSHSPDWSSTAIFILEDDAQNGPDHVDEQRSTLYLASPYAAGGLQHEHYTTSSVLRTIELLLGLPPMTPYDAGARPMYAAFTTKPDPRPFNALAPTTDLDAKNKTTAYRAADSNALNFAQEDRVPDAVLNDILWHAVRGNSPEPKFGAFDAAALKRNGNSSLARDD
jgi:DNA-binding beta-propeller fold protein YncE